MAYGYRAAYTSDHLLIGSTLTGFAGLFRGDVKCATVANGGYVEHTDSGRPADFYWSSDAAGLVTVPFEVVPGTYDATTGSMECHILTTLSAVADTPYYLWVGNAAVTTYQGDDAAFPAYSLVWHLPDGSTLSGADSTSNANDGTQNDSPSAVAGQLDGGMMTTAANSRMALSGGANLQPGTGPATYSAWFKVPSVNPNVIFTGDFGTQDMAIDFDGSGHVRGVIDAGGGSPQLFSTGTYNDNVWHLVHFVRDTANSVLRLYLDGASDATPVADPIDNLTNLSELQAGATGGAFGCAYDEYRIRMSALSADWIAAEYANQKTSQDLFSLGPFIPQGGPSTDTGLMLYTVMG